MGERHLLEIARALATEPKLLLLDEPAAGLNDEETARLAETVRRIRSEGVTVLLVEHDMGFRDGDLRRGRGPGLWAQDRGGPAADDHGQRRGHQSLSGGGA